VFAHTPPAAVVRIRDGSSWLVAVVSHKLADNFRIVDKAVLGMAVVTEEDIRRSLEVAIEVDGPSENISRSLPRFDVS